MRLYYTDDTPSPTVHAALVWVDADGDAFTGTFRLPDDALDVDAVALGASIGTLTNASPGMLGVTRHVATTPQEAVPGPYGSSDLAVFTFECDDGSPAVVAIPAPRPDIFVANTERVDALDVDVAAFIADMLFVPLASHSGSPAVAYRTGVRTRRPPY